MVVTRPHTYSIEELLKLKKKLEDDSFDPKYIDKIVQLIQQRIDQLNDAPTYTYTYNNEIHNHETSRPVLKTP